ncbi:thiamine phosphate synthase [Bacillus suaedaesalsae]|uniref:Thiamine phosphate synthase n=1 Tax=Bacillus suaedaesalsae TaxID=2810349 RepID=A0ABS2DGY9_9BACI|nr:thiamine phosphate synthase [Bacillus suaedaesalsae]MBM6617749.1 thiamine phosphate synthase [Bacillus suaedaesalsae]
MGLHLVSNGRMTATQFSEVVQTVDQYVDYVHIREKQLSARDLFVYVLTLLECGVQSEKLIIHDRVDVAEGLGVRGVQLTTNSLPVEVVRKMNPTLVIGCSTHSHEQVNNAEIGGADFAFYGHVFESISKPGLEPRGLNRVRFITSKTNLPLIAIGGITPENTKSVLDNGASGIAVMSGILDAIDPKWAAKQYWNAIQESKEVQSELKT